MILLFFYPLTIIHTMNDYSRHYWRGSSGSVPDKFAIVGEFENEKYDTFGIYSGGLEDFEPGEIIAGYYGSGEYAVSVDELNNIDDYLSEPIVAVGGVERSCNNRQKFGNVKKNRDKNADNRDKKETNNSGGKKSASTISCGLVDLFANIDSGPVGAIRRGNTQKVADVQPQTGIVSVVGSGDTSIMDFINPDGKGEPVDNAILEDTTHSAPPDKNFDISNYLL